MSGAYKGQPMQAHFGLPRPSDEHFQRWLAMFVVTLEVHCTPSQAEVFRVRARRIADSFRFRLATLRGEVAVPL
jgi:hemoglobin